MTAPFFTGTLGVGTALVAGVLTEPTDPSYARQPIAMLGTSGGVGTNSDIVAFYPQTAWGTLGYFAIYAANGTVQWSGPLNNAVLTVIAQQVAFLPGGLAVNNTTITNALLVPWAANPQRTVEIDTPGIVIRTQAQAGGPTPLAAREVGVTCDDTIDITGLLAPGDYPALASCALASVSGDITVKWCSFQGALVTARTSGGVAGTYTYTLTWTTVSGLTGSAVLTQYVINTSSSGSNNSTAPGAGSYLDISATGTNTGTATVVTAAISKIVSGAGGVRVQSGLPATGFAFSYLIFNATASTLNLYPPSGETWPTTDQFTGGTDVPISMPPYLMLTAVVFSDGTCVAG